MSPVMTNVSGTPPSPPLSRKFTVVSRVLGKQFSNSQAISGAAIRALVSRMVSSTAGESNFRSAGAGRRDENGPAPSSGWRCIVMVCVFLSFMIIHFEVSVNTRSRNAFRV